MAYIRAVVLVLLFGWLGGYTQPSGSTDLTMSKLNPATRLRGIPRAMEEIFRPKRVEYPRGT